MNTNLTIVFALLLLMASCSPIASSVQSSSLSNENVLGSTTPSGPTSPAVPVPAMNICSKLDLANISWPAEIGASSWSSHFALSLNITGSFEGREGWKNIATNSDKQGMSLGLMQQNFGQGTLQPLIIKMFKQDHASVLKNFSSADYQSMKRMLEDWQNGSIAVSVASAHSPSFTEELFPNVEVLNELDTNPDEMVFTQGAEENLSVQWAANNLYTNGAFISRWKTSFQNLATTAKYRTFQVEASTKMFMKAKSYLTYFKFKQLRSLLFLFDIVVQNGGFTSNHLSIYNTWFAKNPNADEKTKLNALLDARLTSIGQYKEDVRSRKASIINGTGKVHGSARNYPQEFCFNPLTTVQ